MTWTSENIKALRDRVGWTRERFASKLGVSYLTVMRWELDHHRPGQLARKSLVRVAKTHGISLDSLGGE